MKPTHPSLPRPAHRGPSHRGPSHRLLGRPLIALAALVALVALGLLAATLPAVAAPPPERGPAGNGPVTPDSQLEALGKEIPGFGGWFQEPSADQGSRLIILSTQPGAARASLARLGLEAAEVRQGRHSFERLNGWKGLLREAIFRLDGVWGLDADEQGNRVVVFAEPGSAETPIRALARGAGVPDDAFHLALEPRPVLTASLRDYDQHKRGGLKIQWEDSLILPNGDPIIGTCTLGFIAYHQGNPSVPPGYTNRGMVTNAHCDDIFVTGTVYHQPTTSYTGFAEESIRPQSFTGGACPSGEECRWSDSQWAVYHPLSGSAFGKIARTTSVGFFTGSITRTSADFKIANEDGTVTQGETLYKMGQTTGWTGGSVIDTCVDIEVTEDIFTSYLLLCQHRVDAGAQPGDSGSPVFHWHSPGNAVDLRGIVFAANQDGQAFWYSSITNIEADLGPLDTTTTVEPYALFDSTTTQWNGYTSFDASDSYDPDGGFIVTYQWTIQGTTTTSAGPYMSYNFGSTPNQYWVTLKVTDEEGQTGTTSKWVSVP